MSFRIHSKRFPAALLGAMILSLGYAHNDDGRLQAAAHHNEFRYLVLKKRAFIRGGLTRWSELFQGVHPNLGISLESAVQIPSAEITCWNSDETAQRLLHLTGRQIRVIGGPICIVPLERRVNRDAVQTSLSRFLLKNQMLKDDTGPAQIDWEATKSGIAEILDRDMLLLPADPGALKWSAGLLVPGGESTAYLEVVHRRPDGIAVTLARFPFKIKVPARAESSQGIGGADFGYGDRLLVKRGDRVAVFYRHSAIQIRLYGKALQDGQFGKKITVITQDGRKGQPGRLKAWITGPGRVVLSKPEPVSKTWKASEGDRLE